jgi:hypothetical protein
VVDRHTHSALPISSWCASLFVWPAEYQETQDVHELFDSLVRLAKQWTRQPAAIENPSPAPAQRTNGDSLTVPFVQAADVDFPLAEMLDMIQHLVCTGRYLRCYLLSVMIVFCVPRVLLCVLASAGRHRSALLRRWRHAGVARLPW